MNSFFKGLAATTALISFAGVAQAQGLGVGQFTPSSGTGTNNVGSGTSLTESDTFAITGEVDRDCSFFTGENAKVINLGRIGVIVTSNVAVNNAFGMAQPVSGQVQTSTAGCNFRNQVRIEKANRARGLINLAAESGGFDEDQFTNELPYIVTARFTAVAGGAVAPGNGITLTSDSLDDGREEGNYGAWRSSFTLAVEVPVAAKAPVAGTYTDNVTVTLGATL